MTVKHSLLAILAQGPCYGYRLRAEFERRTAHTWPLNAGQIYNTLDRLEKAGQVTRGEADEHGHVFWSITDTGRATVAAWFSSPTAHAAARDDMATRIALGASLPGIDIAALISLEQHAARERITMLASSSEAPSDPAGSLFASAAIYRARADLAWLDEMAAGARAGTLGVPTGVTHERPRRGRPRKVTA